MNYDSLIVGGARTPIGEFLGELAPLPAPALGAAAIAAAVRNAGLQPDQVEAVTMGCVLSAGLGQAPARQAALAAGLPQAVNCATVNKMCGSGLQSVMWAHDSIKAGTYSVLVAGGMESMSNAPYLLPEMRGGARVGHGRVEDHMFKDGLEDVYHHRLMGAYGEATAEKYRFSRAQQDQYAWDSLARARKAHDGGGFAGEIAAVTVEGRSGSSCIDSDEHPRRVDPDKIARLKPAFIEGGTVTAANSSALSDGAAALTLASPAWVEAQGLNPVAGIVTHASYSQAPEWFTTAPVGAIGRLLGKTGWTVEDVDLFEINEAFSVVVLAAMQELSIPHDKVNVHGGACALGHPIGASGARILVTLLGALKQRRLKRGIAAICIGGGEAVAVAVEML